MFDRARTHRRKGRTTQRAGRTLIPKEKAIEGEWNIIDDLSGFKIKSSEAIINWDGLCVHRDWSDKRNPQDFLRAVRDQKPLPKQLIRPQGPLQFGSMTEAELIESLLNR